MDLTQQKQEEQYKFPYHHTVTLKPFHLAKHLWWGHVYASYVDEVINRLQDEEDSFDSVVDVGCGDGRLIVELINHFPDKHITGTDYSERSLSFARAFAPEVNFSKDVDGVFDVFTLVEVLEHIPPEEVDSFLSGIHSNLSDHGWGIITVPHKNNPLNSKHYQHFTEETLTKTLEKFFLVQECQHLNARNIWSNALRRLFANSLFILNSRPLLDILFSIYKKYCLHAQSGNATRLLAVVKKR